MNKPTFKRVREVLNYDKESGLFKRLLAPGKRQDLVGAQAGGKVGNGYVLVAVDGKQYYAHRLAWLFVHGRWPPQQIDHINGVRDDNRLCNLRLATAAQNNFNRRGKTRKTSEYKGVYWHSKAEKWTSSIQVKGKQIYLGIFVDPKLAHFEYIKAAKKYYGEYYHP